MHMCTLQRLQPEDFNRLMENVLNSIYKLKNFVHITENIQIELRRISDCLSHLLISVVQSDINAMHKILVDYIGWYKTSRSISAQERKYIWDEIFATMPALLSVTNSTTITTVATDNNDILPFTQNSFLSMYSFIGEIVSNPTHRSMNNSELKRRQCQIINDQINDILMDMAAGDNPHRGNVSTMQDQHPFHFVYELYERHHFYDCFGEFEVVLNILPEELVRISNEIEKSLYTSHTVFVQGRNRGSYQDNLRGDLNNLTDTSVWLSQQLFSYAANRTTNMELSNLIERNMLPKIDFILDHIISMITMKGIKPLLIQASALSRNTYRWYKKALDIMQMSVPRYEDRGVRFLHIWRHPMAVLENEDILQFKYSDSDAWRSWGTRTTLGDFIVSGKAETLISTIAKGFSSNLFHGLTHIKTQLTTAYVETIESFDAVISELTNVHEEEFLDEKFIL